MHAVMLEFLKKQIIELIAVCFFTIFISCLKISEKILIMTEGHTKFLMLKTCHSNNKINAIEAAEFSILVKSFSVEKTKACDPPQDFIIEFVQPL